MLEPWLTNSLGIRARVTEVLDEFRLQQSISFDTCVSSIEQLLAAYAEEQPDHKASDIHNAEQKSSKNPETSPSITGTASTDEAAPNESVPFERTNIEGRDATQVAMQARPSLKGTDMDFGCKNTEGSQYHVAVASSSLHDYSSPSAKRRHSMNSCETFRSSVTYESAVIYGHDAMNTEIGRSFMDAVARHDSMNVSKRTSALSSHSALTRMKLNFKRLPHRLSLGTSGNFDARDLDSLAANFELAKCGRHPLLEQWSTIIPKLLEIPDDRNSGLRASSNSFEILSMNSLISSAVKHRQTCTHHPPVMHPTSWKRLCWDMFSMLAVLYDIAMLPMMIYDFGESPVDQIIFWLILSFWTSDILLSFCTGYQVEGTIEMSFRSIAQRYLRGWFAIDLIAVLPDWIVLCIGSGKGSNQVIRLGKAAKVIRLFRSLRLLRVFRLVRAWKDLRDGLTNQYLISILEFAKFVLFLLFMSHYSACVFYGLSKIERGGWVQEFELHSATPLSKYLTSLHWATAQIHGSMNISPVTKLERTYAIMNIFVGLIASSVFISSITNLSLRLQKLRQETFLKTHKLLCYLEQNNVSAELTARMQSFARHATDVNAVMGKEVELLKHLPPNLLKELDQEIKTRVLHGNYPLKKVFKMLPDGMSEFFLTVISQLVINPGTHLFEKAEASGKMFVLWRGKVMYNKHSKNPGGRPSVQNASLRSSSDSRAFNTFSLTQSLSKALSLDRKSENVLVEGCRCIAEMNLWTSWRHRADCLISGHPAIFSIDAQKLGELLLATQNENLCYSLRLAFFLCHYSTQYLEWMQAQRNEDLDDLSVFPQSQMKPFKDSKVGTA